MLFIIKLYVQINIFKERFVKQTSENITAQYTRLSNTFTRVISLKQYSLSEQWR